MDLYTFPIIFEPEVRPLQLRSQNLSLLNLKVPSGNRMGSKYCTLAINSIWNLYFAAYICSQPNKISVFCFVGKDKMLQEKSICCGFRDQVNSSFQVWLLKTIKQNMLFRFNIYYMPFFLKTYPQCNGPNQTKEEWLTLPIWAHLDPFLFNFDPSLGLNSVIVKELTIFWKPIQ